MSLKNLNLEFVVPDPAVARSDNSRRCANHKIQTLEKQILFQIQRLLFYIFLHCFFCLVTFQGFHIPLSNYVTEQG